MPGAQVPRVGLGLPCAGGEGVRFEVICIVVRVEYLAPRAGLEPATKRLTAAHSTVELPGNAF